MESRANGRYIDYTMAKKQSAAKEPKPQFRFGIGEWYGKSFVQLTAEQRKRYAEIQLLDKDVRPAQACPFLSSGRRSVSCWKIGGVCSLRSYERSRVTEEVGVSTRGSTIRATCPSRFEQGRLIYSWIGEVILSDKNAVPIGQVSFLERVSRADAGARPAREDVGRIDN